MQKISRKTFLQASATAGISAVTAGLMPTAALAQEDSGTATDSAEAASGAATEQIPDFLLGVFTNSANDCTDTFYVSTDGVHMQRISQAFRDLTPNDPNKAEAEGSMQDGRTWNLYCFNCPSLIWHNGLFWMLANEKYGGDDGTLRLVVSASDDLVHWCDQRQVKVQIEGAPKKGNGESTQFDAVAADWAVDESGKVWAVASLGRYGSYHGEPERDEMYPYLIGFDKLAPQSGFDPKADPKNNGALDITPGKATLINLPEGSSNRIDGSLYFEGGVSYLSIKRDGITNEIWKTANLSKAGTASSWTKVNGNVLTGYEAPSLTKLGDTYYFYTDRIATWQGTGKNGTHVQTSKRLESGWSQESLVQAYDKDANSYTVSNNNNPNGNGPRHGTVIRVTDEKAKRIVWAQRAAAGWPPTNAKRGTMFRLYNPHSGEHFYTATFSECDGLIAAGWRYEGFGWVAPTSGQPVHRLYNPNAGDHHYTPNEGEKNDLIKAGWKYEGVGWYSGGSTPIYRQYNPNAVSGSHNYTFSKDEVATLVRAGWHDEGIGWYAASVR